MRFTAQTMTTWKTLRREDRRATEGNHTMRNIVFGLVGAGALGFAMLALSPGEAAADEAVLYKNPQCGCCEEYAEYMRENGFEVRVEPTHDLISISREVGIPEELMGCHTVVLDDYVVSGHVPIDVVTRMLEERPDIKGITLPGMPLGSPGMGGEKTEPFTIYSIGDDAPEVYAVE